MLRLPQRSLSARRLRAQLGLGLLLGVLVTAACSSWRLPPPHEVRALPDATATYLVVLDTLKNEHYTIVEQDAATHTVRVRSHVDEKSTSRVSVISLHVDGGAVYLSGSGYLVRPDGTTHHALISELASLDEALQKRFSGASPAASASTAPLAPASVPAGSLPLAWSEPASNASVWGTGNFTCLPVKLADEDQTQLSLKLSNGETADVLLSLARSPELCRSPAQCKLPGGCPALGIADAERVSRLASRLSKREIAALATLYSRGQAIAVIDLAKHGSIAQAMAEKR
jgi:hypothetical protein